MSNVPNKVVVLSESATFGSANLKFQSAPVGVPEKADLPDVTVCDDVEQRFAASAVTEDDEFTIRLGGMPPAINTVAALTLSQKIRVGSGTATTKTISCGQCILVGIVPVDIEAAGGRVGWYDCTFRPNGTRT